MSFPAGAGLLTDLLMLLNKTHHSHQHKHSLLLCTGEVGPDVTAFSGSLSLPDYAAGKEGCVIKGFHSGSRSQTFADSGTPAVV